jgi:hypothetical protein
MSGACVVHEWDFREGPGSETGGLFVAEEGVVNGVCEFVVHEWDFRAAPGSKIDSSLVAMEVASGGAGHGEGAA